MAKQLSSKQALAGLALGAAALAFSIPGYALVITPTLDAATLKNALLAGGGAGINLSTVSVSVSGHSSNGAVSAGTYTNASGTYGIGPGVVISSGDVADYGDGPNVNTANTTQFAAPATLVQQALLFPISGQDDHFDVTQIDISFDMLAGFDTVFFNVTFGSEEFAEFVNSGFIDAFGLFVNDINIAVVDGDPVNIDHPDMQFLLGTELDGILGGSQGAFGPYVHTFSAAVNPTSNRLTFIIADSSDDELDSTAYISQLGGSAPPVDLPEPATLAMLGLGLAGLGCVRRRRT